MSRHDGTPRRSVLLARILPIAIAIAALTVMPDTASGQQTGTIVLAPSDTSLMLDQISHGGEPTLSTYTWPNYSPGNVVLLKFDLSGLPAGAQITLATLHLALVASDTKSESTYTVGAHKVLSKNPIVARATGYTFDGVAPWTASTCCYHGAPLAQSDIASAEDSKAINKSAGFKTWTITRMAQEWLAQPAVNFGLVLNADATKRRDRFRSFASAEHANATLRPYLRVTFTAADAQPPSVAVTAPAPGALVSQSVALTASATDNVGVTGVQFHVDGSPVGAERTQSPFSLNWDSSWVSDGPHAITAVARDSAGNTATSSSVAITVENGVLILRPEDTFLNLNTTNYSQDTQLRTYTWPDFKPSQAILLKFNLSSVPPGSTIEEARLLLALVGSDAVADTYAVSAHQILTRNPVVAAATGYLANAATGWTPSACCDNGVPLAQADLSGPYDRQLIDRVSGFKTWTITQLAQLWQADPSSNFGLLLNADASKPRDRYRAFASSENPDPALRPFLRLKILKGVAPDAAPPVISGVTASAVTSTSATISWATDEPSDTQVDFGTTTAYGQSTPINGPLVTVHTVTVTGLQAAKLYHYRVLSRDQAGNLATSSDLVFTTLASPDVTPPTVNVTAPAQGASVSGTVTVSANAADTVGVVGVQFRIDGAALGAEDTLAPYTISWNTTSIGNGTHTITAVARDLAGNSAISAAVAVSVNNAVASAPVFRSDWSTATGTSANAISDGGRWPNYWEFNGGSTTQLMSVVAGGVNGHNALRVLQRGSTFAANLQLDNFVPASRDYYLRYYMRNDDTSAAGDHVVTVDTFQYPNLTFVRKYSSPTGWTFHTSVYGCGYTYPIGHWGPSTKLANGQWYRFEFFVDFVDATHVQVHPRVYNAAGTLLWSDADFRQSDFGGAWWNGRSDWTLASYYAAGHSFCVDPNWVNDFGLGNNGQQGAADTGLSWYFSAIEIRTDTWPGPVAAPAP